MKRITWEAVYRIGVVLLLATIVLQLGGWEVIRSAVDEVVWQAKHVIGGKKEEAPAPSAGQGPAWDQLTEGTSAK